MKHVLKLWSGSNASGVVLFCPGCKERHYVQTSGDGLNWNWNASFTEPTLSPSVDVRFERTDIHRTPTRTVCHFLVREGKIAFQSDSTHEHAGKTVPLPEAESWRH